jgi:diguanylate cyclase (GGDEF)-like protein
MFETQSRRPMPHTTTPSDVSTAGHRSDPGCAEIPIATTRALAGLHTEIWVFDPERLRIVWANHRALGLWHAKDVDELRGRPLDDDISESTLRRLLQLAGMTAAGGSSFGEVWTIFDEPEPRTFRVWISGLRLVDGRNALLCEVLSELAETPERVRSADALSHTPVMISLYGEDTLPLYRNTAAADSIVRLGQPFAERFADPADHARLMEMIDRDGHGLATARILTCRGVRWHEISARRCRDTVGGTPALLVSETDVSRLKDVEHMVRHLAEHDLLTGLPNRTCLQREVTRRIEAAEAAGTGLSMLLIDLDRFKTVNDSLGHQTGDRLLMAAAKRLLATLHDGDFLARLGGDEFLVVTDADESAAPRRETTAQRILSAFETPLSIPDHDLVVTASLGVARFPEDGGDLDTLLRHADLAMYSAKEHGCNRAISFTREMTAAIDEQLTIDSSLRRALELDELELWYQPRLSTAENRIIAAEALVRWRHPTRGLLLPGLFIPHAEKRGLIDRIGEWVLHEAATRRRRLHEAGHDMIVSLNLSGRQFADPHFLERVERVLTETGCDPRGLQLEITESVLLGNDPTAVRILKRLGDIGFTLAIDDFGTGYSNLTMLQNHRIDTLKIDRSFVVALQDQPELTELILGLCRLLGMTTVAEGVETEAQLAWLKARDCHEYQGYLFSPAVPFDDFVALLERQRVLLTHRRNERSALNWPLAPLVDDDGDVGWSSGGA